MPAIARRTLLVLFAVALLVSPARGQWPPDSITNLKVLPKDIEFRELVDIMAGFTRALGVRCSHCHMGEETQPLSEYDFASDDRMLKRKARVMLQMVRRVNAELERELPERVAPRIEVQCFTCHRGVREPRTLQAVLLAAYDSAGVDSTLATYRALRERYYGRAVFDFGEVALADVAQDIDARGRLEDAVTVAALNVEMNPSSSFAKRMHGLGALAQAFGTGVEAGTARYRALRAAYGERVISEPLVNQLGYRLLREQRPQAAVAVFKLNVEAYPDSWNTHDSLGEGYAALGEKARAIASYERSLALNPNNQNAVQKLRELRGG